MKTFLINPFNRTITAIEIADGRIDIEAHMTDMHSALNCDLFAAACEINAQGDTIFVDDEGLLVPDLNAQRFFVVSIDETNQVFAGMGLVMGLESEEGDSIEASCTLEDLEKIIDFVPNEFIPNA